jgi:hypothetical protein
MTDLSDYELVRGVDKSDREGCVAIQQEECELVATVAPVGMFDGELITEPFSTDPLNLIKDEERERARAALSEAE